LLPEATAAAAATATTAPTDCSSRYKLTDTMILRKKHNRNAEIPRLLIVQFER